MPPRKRTDWRCDAGHPITARLARCEICVAQALLEELMEATHRERREAEIVAASIPKGDMIIRSHDGSVQRFRMPRMARRVARRKRQ